MSGDLIDSIESLLQSRLGSKAAEALGSPVPATRTALRVMAPTIMAGVAEQCGSVDQAEDLLTTLRGARRSDPTGADLIKLLAERAPHVGARAPTFLSQLLFGAREDAVVDAIAAASGLPPRSVSHLLEVCVVATFSMLRDHARDEEWDGARMRQALQLERMLIKMDLDRQVAIATGFDWLASDDPSAPLFAPKPPAAAIPSAPADKTRDPAEGAGSTTNIATPATPGNHATPVAPKDSAPRTRKSIVDLLHARMAQGSLPSAMLGSPITPNPTPGRSVYAERRLDEWLEPLRKTALGSTAGPGGTAAPASNTAADHDTPVTPAPTAARASPTDLPPLDPTIAGHESQEVAATDDGEAAVREVRLEIRAATEREIVDAAPAAIAPAPIAPTPAMVTLASDAPPADTATPAAPVDDDVPDFEKTMPLPFNFARHLASARWPFSIFECRDPVFVTAPESYATMTLPGQDAIHPPGSQQALVASTIAHSPAPLAQSSPTLAPDSAPAKRTAPAITRPLPPGPTIFTDDVATDPKQNPTKSISNWWLGPVVIVAAVVALIILSYRISGQRPISEPQPQAPASTTHQVPAATDSVKKSAIPAAPPGVPGTPGESKVAEAAALVAVNLPGGAQLQVRDNGFIANLSRALSAPGAEAGQRFVMDEISFDRDTAMLAPGADAQLRQLTELLGAYPQLKLRIEGHTDRDGDTAVIRALSTDRAASVKATLILNGISEERIQSQGFGADRPLSTSTSSQERAQNRRIEVVVVER